MQSPVSVAVGCLLGVREGTCYIQWVYGCMAPTGLFLRHSNPHSSPAGPLHALVCPTGPRQMSLYSWRQAPGQEQRGPLREKSEDGRYDKSGSHSREPSCPQGVNARFGILQRSEFSVELWDWGIFLDHLTTRKGIITVRSSFS